MAWTEQILPKRSNYGRPGARRQSSDFHLGMLTCHKRILLPNRKPIYLVRNNPTNAACGCLFLRFDYRVSDPNNYNRTRDNTPQIRTRKNGGKVGFATRKHEWEEVLQDL